MRSERNLDRRAFIGSALATGLMLGSAKSQAFAQQSSVPCPARAAQDPNATVLGEAVVQDASIFLSFAATQSSVLLRSIKNKKSGIEYLEHPTSIFKLTTTGKQACAADSDYIVDTIHVPDSGRGLHVVGHMKSTPVTFFLEVEAAHGDGTVRMKLRLRNDGLEILHVRAALPELKGLMREHGGKPLMAAVPQEAAGVAVFSDKVNLGMPMNPAIGLPTAMNVMELVSIYDSEHGGGLFVLDANGDIDRGLSPLQMTLTADALSGLWITQLQPLSEQTLPGLVIGVHDAGDWHTAVDCYTRLHRPTWTFPSVPAWFRDQGAIYSYSGAGAGGIYMNYPAQGLDTRIGTFHQLPKLLDEAQTLGTNIVYLWDYWQGAPEGDHPAYWNKGDYIIRSDMGGEAGLREGIERIHQQGGRVILYIEWYIMYWYAEIAKKHGEEWAQRDAEGNPTRLYPENFALVPGTLAWQDHIVAVAERLVRDFNVDGIYLDSMGWEMNWPSTTLSERRVYTAEDYSLGALKLTDRVRSAIRAIRSDAIVMGETTSGPLPHHWDGGLSADFAWLGEQNQHKVLGSPVRYGMPEINVFSNGNNRNEMNQIYAAGHSLALCNLHLPDAPYIRTLVEARQRYKDALIYGAQLYQPRSGDADVIAYFYRGDKHNVITVVNLGDRSYKGSLELESADQSRSWQEVLPAHGIYSVAERRIALSLEPKTLRILVESRS
jgi:hypothetical protein